MAVATKVPAGALSDIEGLARASVFAVDVPAKAEPSDIDTEMAATVVPAAALSGRGAAFG